MAKNIFHGDWGLGIGDWVQAGFLLFILYIELLLNKINSSNVIYRL